MNNDKYKEIIEQAKQAPGEEKINCMITMLSMIGLNHLPSIDRKIKKLNKVIIVFGASILLAILFQSEISISAIVKLIGSFL